MKYIRNFVCIMVATIYLPCCLSQPISPVECPKTSSYQLVLLPDPEDCSKFFMCGPNGQYMHMSCPPGLYFNPKLDVCDYPQNMDCTPLPTSISTTTTTIVTTTTTSNIPHYNITTTGSPGYNFTTTTTSQNNVTTLKPQNNVTDGPSYPTIPNLTTDQILNTTANSSLHKLYAQSHVPSSIPNCPANSGSQLIILPDPYDCNSYYMCTATGLPIHMHCPDGLFFNPDLQVCDFPQNISCIPLTTTPPTPNQNVTTPVYSTYHLIHNATSYAPEITTPEYSTDSSSITPEHSTNHYSTAPGNVSLVPNKNSTSATLSVVTTTLSPNNTTTVILENSTLYVTNSSPTTNNSSRTSEPANFAITAPPSIASKCPMPLSPSVPPTHLANPEDCTSFYTCVADNTAFLQLCQTGLLFNEQKQMCDHQHNVECMVSH